MSRYSSLSDDFYVNMNLSTEMDLPTTRDSVLHYFERLQKQFPTMRHFYCRDKGDFILEEDKEQGHYRWSTIEPRRLCSGYVNPGSLEEALAQHHLVLELAPYMLSVSPIDCEAIDLLMGFDFTYRGNHNELVAEALGVSPALERMLDMPGATVVSCEPTITLALDEDCRTQCRLSIENRTNAYQIRMGEFPEDQLSVYVTARRYGGLDPGASYVDVLESLKNVCCEVIDNHVAENVLRPLARAIATK
ncbi:MAG: hypothetical protein DWQ37_00590 [Planctomycetota bacterium]|nr:MAG: hypothetical protein DWQ37_00590 [Planctomycetota bacterium]